MYCESLSCLHVISVSSSYDVICIKYTCKPLLSTTRQLAESGAWAEKEIDEYPFWPPVIFGAFEQYKLFVFLCFLPSRHNKSVTLSIFFLSKKCYSIERK